MDDLDLLMPGPVLVTPITTVGVTVVVIFSGTVTVSRNSLTTWKLAVSAVDMDTDVVRLVRVRV